MWRKFLCSALVIVSIGILGLAKTKIVVAGRDGGYGQVLEMAAALYTAEHPEVEIEAFKLPYAGRSEKLVIDLAEKIGAYDVVMLDDT